MVRYLVFFFLFIGIAGAAPDPVLDQRDRFESIGLRARMVGGQRHGYLQVDQFYTDSALKKVVFLIEIPKSIPEFSKPQSVNSGAATVVYTQGRYFLTYAIAETPAKSFQLLEQFKSRAVASIRPWKRLFSISSAYAEQTSPHCSAGNLGAAAFPDIEELKNLIFQDPYLARAFACLEGVVAGIGDSTVGAVKDSLGMIHKVIVGLSDPQAALSDLGKKWEKVKSFLKNVQDEVAKMVDGIIALPGEAKAQILCNVIGSLGTDALITALTEGAGAAKLVVTIKSYTQKLTKLHRLASLLKRGFNGLDNLFKNGNFIKRLVKGNVPDEEIEFLAHLEKSGMTEVAGRFAGCAL